MQLDVARSFAVAAAVGRSLVAPCIGAEPRDVRRLFFITEKHITEEPFYHRRVFNKQCMFHHVLHQG